VESFQTAAECLGPIGPGYAAFAVTRGQFSMTDAILHAISCTGPAFLSLWTWNAAEYDLNFFRDLMACKQITGGRLVIDEGARRKERGNNRQRGAVVTESMGYYLLKEWQGSFGEGSVKLCKNHAKIATVEGGGLRVLLRGSMNLNSNPRFEQLDVTEGGPDFDLVRQIEDELEIVPLESPSQEARRVSRLGEAFSGEQLAMFEKVKVWHK